MGDPAGLQPNPLVSIDIQGVQSGINFEMGHGLHVPANCIIRFGQRVVQLQRGRGKELRFANYKKDNKEAIFFDPLPSLPWFAAGGN